MPTLSGLDRWMRRASLAMGRIPDGVAARFGRDRAINDRGQALDPQLGLMIWSGEKLGVVPPKTTPALAREASRRSLMLIEGPKTPVARVQSEVLDAGMKIRTYEQDPGAPTLVYLHGGGWAVGDLDSHDGLCRRLCVGAGWRVVSVDYPLAPEHPCPAPQAGVLAAFREIRARVAASGGDPARVAVGGDSAGGHLSALLCHQLRALGEAQPALQVLIYPATDLTRSFSSHRTLGRGYLLTADDIDWFLAQYQAPDPASPEVSPLRAADLRGLAPAVVTTAGFDPLRDEGEAYARRLAEAGVPVTHLDETAMVHGYVHMDAVNRGAAAALERLIAAIRVQ